MGRQLDDDDRGHAPLTIPADTQPTLGSVIRAAIDARLATVFTSLLARVVSYDHTRQSCSAQPVTQQARTADDGGRVATPLPVIADVPVQWPGGGGFRVTFPLAAGDYVLLVFTSGEISGWKVGGGASLDPKDDRRHHLSDAVAVPCVRDFGHPYSSAPTDGASIGKDGGPTIEFKATEIQAGGTKPLVTYAEFMNHTHRTAGTGPPVAPTALAPPPAAALVGTSVLKGG